MIQDEDYWCTWERVERTARWLGAVARLPDVDVEIAQAELFARFERSWQTSMITNAEAWTRVTFGRMLGALRRHSRLVWMEIEPEARPAEARSCDAGTMREWCAAADRGLKQLLSSAETAVYDCVRAGCSLKETARRLGMSARDVRVRFRRVLKKLGGFLADSVPPPLNDVSRGQRRTSWSTANVGTSAMPEARS